MSNSHIFDNNILIGISLKMGTCPNVPNVKTFNQYCDNGGGPGDISNCVQTDDCGICGGNGIPDGNCDCSGNIVECSGTCGGPAINLGCGCGLPGPSGCDNVCNSTAVEDCAGVCGGDAVIDDCGVCGGNGEL